MLDKTDLKILSALQENGRITYSELARQVHLTSPAVAERIRKLEETGIITGYHAAVKLEQMGYPIICFVHLTVPSKTEKQLIDFAKGRSEVLECYLTAGRNTFVLKIVGASVDHLNSFLNELLRFGHSTSFIVLSEIISRKTIHKTGKNELLI